MVVIVNSDIESRIEKLMRTGDYQDVSDVLSRAIDLLAEEQKIRHLRSILDQARSSSSNPATPELFAGIRDRVLKAFEGGDVAELDPDVWPAGER